MQIIINRIAVVAEDRRLVDKVKWGTAALITSVNIAVFVIWIPGHMGVQPYVKYTPNCLYNIAKVATVLNISTNTGTEPPRSSFFSSMLA